MRQCVEDSNRTLLSPPFTQTRFFRRLSSRSCYHTPLPLHGTTSTAYAGGMITTPSGARKPPCHHCLFPLAPTPAAAIACICGHASKVMFFFLLFFVSFLTIAETS